MLIRGVITFTWNWAQFVSQFAFPSSVLLVLLCSLSSSLCRRSPRVLFLRSNSICLASLHHHHQFTALAPRLRVIRFRVATSAYQVRSRRLPFPFLQNLPTLVTFDFYFYLFHWLHFVSFLLFLSERLEGEENFGAVCSCAFQWTCT